MKRTVYIAHPDYQQALLQELTDVVEVRDNLIFTGHAQKTECCFALDTWFDVQTVPIESINAAVKILRSQGKYWYHYPQACFRRATLIAEQLRTPFKKLITFPATLPNETVGVFCLLDAHTLVYATQTDKRVPLGTVHFIEDKIHPPNRAYLKLWEALSVFNAYPRAKQTVIELGASPGGWTYVLANLGANVIAVDKAPLAKSLQPYRNITYLKQSAFALSPNDFKQAEWLFSDIACYPERLYQLIIRWLDAGFVKNFICTIKLQGQIDFSILRKFQQIANSRVLHLYYNKHEVTFFLRVK